MSLCANKYAFIWVLYIWPIKFLSKAGEAAVSTIALLSSHMLSCNLTFIPGVNQKSQNQGQHWLVGSRKVNRWVVRLFCPPRANFRIQFYSNLFKPVQNLQRYKHHILWYCMLWCTALGCFGLYLSSCHLIIKWGNIFQIHYYSTNGPLQLANYFWPAHSAVRLQLQLKSWANLLKGSIEEFTSKFKKQIVAMETARHVYYFR
jgi:hypothetical protein